MENLWYEEERLSTFNDWPVSFISPEELAREGFYYLHSKDFCACVSCLGIIGEWEQGDIPRNEHLRYFPYCSFAEGKITPNVPITRKSVLTRNLRESVVDVDGSSSGFDVCGIRRIDNGGRFISGSNIVDLVPDLVRNRKRSVVTGWNKIKQKLILNFERLTEILVPPTYQIAAAPITTTTSTTNPYTPIGSFASARAKKVRWAPYPNRKEFKNKDRCLS